MPKQVDSVVVRVVYDDLSYEYLRLDIDMVTKAISGLAEDTTVHLGNKLVVEMHVISTYAHKLFTKIDMCNENGYVLSVINKDYMS